MTRLVVAVALAFVGVAVAHADPAGFICPDHTVVTSADECPTSGNKAVTTPFEPFPTPGHGGGGGSGGLLGLLGLGGLL